MNNFTMSSSEEIVEDSVNRRVISSSTESDFSESSAAPYTKCLNGVPNTTVVRCIVGPGGGTILDAMIAANYNLVDEESINNSIDDLRRGTAVINGLEPEFALAIRVYSSNELKAYEILNSPFYVENRSIELIFNQRLYMRLLIKSLRQLSTVANGSYSKVGKFYKGMKIKSSSNLKERFDAFFQNEALRNSWSGVATQDQSGASTTSRPFFAEGNYYTFAGITSVSENPIVAGSATYCDHLYFEFDHVRAVNVKSLSAHPKEDEWIVIPPLVVKITRTSWVSDRLVVYVEQVQQSGATYLDDDSEDVDGEYADEETIQQWIQAETENPGSTVTGTIRPPSTTPGITVTARKVSETALPQEPACDEPAVTTDMATDIDEIDIFAEDEVEDTVDPVASNDDDDDDDDDDNSEDGPSPEINDEPDVMEPEAPAAIEEDAHHPPQQIRIPDGTGVVVYEGAMVFDAVRRSWIPHGLGTWSWHDGDSPPTRVFEGIWNNGTKPSSKKLRFKAPGDTVWSIQHEEGYGYGTYTGDMRYDPTRQLWVAEGQGRKIWQQGGSTGSQIGAIYEGHWRNGFKHGRGRFKVNGSADWVEENFYKDNLRPLDEVIR